MVMVIKQGSTRKSMDRLLQKLLENKTSKKGFNAKKFCGILDLKEDALAIQKKLRNEWE